jgi:predicted PurR-regulated permease PerM
MTSRAEDTAASERFRKVFLLLLVIGISVVFLLMIRRFLMAVLLAAIFSGMAYPIYSRLLKRFRGRRAPASAVAILIVLLLVVGPISGFFGIVVSEAVDVSQAAGPWIERQISQMDRLEGLFQRIPLVDRIPGLESVIPDADEIVGKAGEAVTRTGTFLVNSLAAATRGTMTFFLNLFIMLYAMFFFLMDGRSILDRILFYVPLSSEDEHRLVERFVSVTRATLKGSLLIGIIQGGLAGIGFWVAGIPGPAFWGTVMAVLSIIPALGTPLVWIPAVIYLFVVGKIVAGIGLLIWCGAIVGTADNFLRPWLIGKDTKMSDLLVLLSTLGGLVLFGAVGFIIGPIVAALFVTVWDLYGATFQDVLPEVRPVLAGGPPGALEPPAPEGPEASDLRNQGIGEREGEQQFAPDESAPAED